MEVITAFIFLALGIASMLGLLSQTQTAITVFVFFVLIILHTSPFGRRQE